MSDKSKPPFFFRLGEQPLSPRNGNGRKPHLVADAFPGPEKERQPSIKHVYFFLAVAILLFVTSRLGTSSMSGVSTSMLNVRFDLSLQQSSNNVAAEGHQPKSIGHLVQFRLTNQGTQPFLCPVRSATNVPIGHVVYRGPGGSEWMTLPESSSSAVLPPQELVDQSPAWIEIPPGGWVNGKFYDPGRPVGDHAYVINLKSKSDARVVSVVSSPYHFTTN